MINSDIVMNIDIYPPKKFPDAKKLYNLDDGNLSLSVHHQQ